MIGGNVRAKLAQANGDTDSIGIRSKSLTAIATLTGWLDFVGGQDMRMASSKILENTTHVFVAEYQDTAFWPHERLCLNCEGKSYRVTFIDDPMGIHDHLELFLEYVG